MSPLLIVVLIVWLISAIGMVLFILMHSSKGTGVSDMIASTMYSQTSGSGIVEKNLDRITIVFAVLFMVSLIIMMIIFPHGTIG